MKDTTMTTDTQLEKLATAKAKLTDDEKSLIRYVARRSRNRGDLVSTEQPDGSRHTTVKLEAEDSVCKMALTYGQAFGSLDDKLITTQLNYLDNIVHVGKGDARMNTILAMLYGLAPKNEVEGLLAAQIVATNHVAMRMLSQSLESQELEAANHYTNRAHKAQSLMIRQLELYHTMRSGGQTTQKVIVEKVEVQNGGQAIVGAVAGGGGSKQKSEG